MQLSDLIIFGRLGNIVDGEEETYLFKPNNNFQPIIFSEASELFLIFDNTTVRYTDFLCSKSNNKFVINFDDYFINEDIKVANNVLLALAPDDYNQLCKEEQLIYPTAKVVFEKKIIGTILSTFDNGTYETLIIKTNEKEVMIPLVNQYVVKIEEDFIELQNIAELLEL